jgi:hypothetical protein
LSAFLSATRGWIIAFTVVLLLTAFLIDTNKGISRFITIAITGFIIVFALMFFSPMLESQMNSSFRRVSTIENVFKGDITAGGTSIRLSERGPKVLTKFKERPLFGFGYSDVYFEYADVHVGHHTILLNGGVIGYIIFTFIFIKWLIIIIKNSSNKLIKKKHGNALKIYALSLIFIYIIHSTSHIFWGFTLNSKYSTFFAFVLLLNSFNIAVLKEKFK